MSCFSCMLSTSQLSCLSLSMSLGLSGLKADIGKIGRIRSLQVALIFDTPGPPTMHHQPAWIPDFWITGSCLSYNAVWPPAAPRTAYSQRLNHMRKCPCIMSVTVFVFARQLPRPTPVNHFAVNPLRESEYTSECTATGRQTSGTSSRSVPITQIGSLSLASLPWRY